MGGGPAGLMLSHLLSLAGIDSVVVDDRTRSRDREHRARGHPRGRQRHAAHRRRRGSERLLTAKASRTKASACGFAARATGSTSSTWSASQPGCTRRHDVFTDLADARARDGGDVRFGIRDTRVVDVTSDRPAIICTTADGDRSEIRCDYLVGADGSRSVCRFEIPQAERVHYFREYPFAWFGILAQAPKSAPELVYAHSPRGFALISQRTETLQRMYFQCDPGEDTGAWSDDRVWAELQARVAGPDGFTLTEGPITDKAVLRFRSFVCRADALRQLLLAGDAAHTVPPTGAKGLNLALADVRVLAEVLERAVAEKDHQALDEYSPRALARVWKHSTSPTG